MQNLRLIFLSILLAGSIGAIAQPSSTIATYINTYKDLAIAEMQRTGVPAAITLAQGIYESGAGQSVLVLSSNNHFGIKCKSNWKGESVKHDDDERAECFRKYPKAEDSYKDHSDFLKNGQRYAFLFQLDPADYTGWANGLKKAGYATNPKYPQVLIKMVEEYGLQEYTLIAMGKLPPNDNILVVVNEKITSNPPPVEEIQTQEKTIVNKSAIPIVNYPTGKFTINETKVVYVKKGTSYFAIAKEYDVDLSKLFEFNEIPRTELNDKDQLVYLQRKRKTGAEEFHIVQPGETLYDIAQLQGIRLESLRELNWLNENDKPAPGQRLSLHKKSTSMPKLTVREKYAITSTQ